MANLTDRLSSLPHFVGLTQHPFFKSATSITLPDAHISLLVAQMQIAYGQALPRFIAQLILKIPLDDSRASPLATRTLSLLSRCIANTSSDAAFCNDFARTHNLAVEQWGERKGTRDGIAELARVGAFGSLEDGLVFLWGVEKLVSGIWSGVHHALKQPSALDGQSQPLDDPTAEVMRDLTYHWTDANPEFTQLVKDLGDLVDDYFAPVVAGESLSGGGAPATLAQAEALWARIFELAQEAFPSQGDEDKYRVSQ